MHIRHGAVVATVFLAGCQPDLDGELKADGNFTDLRVFELDDAPWAAARAGSQLVLLSLAAGDRCEVGPVERFMPANAGMVVTWTPGQGGCGTLGFVDTSCRTLMEPIACVAPPVEVTSRVLGGSWLSHSFVSTEDGGLRLVDPWTASVVELGSAVKTWRWAEAASLWMLDGSALVLRDLDGASDRELGSEVSDVTFISHGAAVYADRDGVWWVRSALEEPELLAAGGCAPRATRDGSGVAYLAPCAERRLVSHDLETGTISVIASGVDDFRADTSPIFFEQGDVLFAHVAGEIVEVAGQAELGSLRRVTHDGQTAHLLLDAGARLLRFDGVATHVLFEDVAAFQVRHEHIAVLSRQGTLLLQPEGGGAIATMASGVPLDRFGFGSQLEALGWIGNFDGTRGQLELASLTTDDRIVVDDEVSEFVEVRSDTLPGVAYLVPDGERAGIWLATP